jgi:hypothetical protein
MKKLRTDSVRGKLATVLFGVLCSHLLSKNLKIEIYEAIILLVLYGRETWSLTRREEHRLRAFENRLLRRIIEPEREEVAGSWRRVQN